MYSEPEMHPLGMFEHFSTEWLKEGLSSLLNDRTMVLKQLMRWFLWKADKWVNEEEIQPMLTEMLCCFADL